MIENIVWLFIVFSCCVTLYIWFSASRFNRIHDAKMKKLNSDLAKDIEKFKEGIKPMSKYRVTLYDEGTINTQKANMKFKRIDPDFMLMSAVVDKVRLDQFLAENNLKLGPSHQLQNAKGDIWGQVLPL